MTHQELRDWFATHAPAIPEEFARVGRKVSKVIECADGREKKARVTEWETDAQHAARWAYEYADAMLAARGAQ